MADGTPLDLSPLRAALASLEDGLAVVDDTQWFDQQSAKVKNTLVAGVIQNVEFVYEIGFKMRRQLEAEADSPAEVDQSNFRADLWDMVRGILRRHVPEHEVWAFGSRARWTAKPHSDLDLAVISATPLPLAVSGTLADAFAESDLPWRVDVVDWATTSDTFRQIIERDKVVVQ